MTVREYILVELTMESITKITGLEAELTEQVAKIETTEDMFEKGCKYGFLISVLAKARKNISEK